MTCVACVRSVETSLSNIFRQSISSTKHLALIPENLADVRRRTTRHPLLLPFALFSAMAALFLSSPASAGSFKAGGGMFFNNNEPGGGISVDLGDEGLALSPFVDYFGKSGSRFFSGGLNIVAKRAGGEQSKLYIGVGGGIASVDVEESSAGITGSASKTQALADFVLGIEFDLHDNIGGFLGRQIGNCGHGRRSSFPH